MCRHGRLAPPLNGFSGPYFAAAGADEKSRGLNVTNGIQSLEALEELLSRPTQAVIETMRRLPGDILVLGAGGKIGLSLGQMAHRASRLAGVRRRVIGVSRFSDLREEARWQAAGLETIRCDLLEEEAVALLPEAPNLLYLAGRKFGATSQPSATWALNTWLPGVICRRYPRSRIVAYSTGNVYGLASVAGGGSTEEDRPAPLGEYAMSCLGRERIFEHFSRLNGTPVAVVRLFYACEMRYGVLVDLATKILEGEPIDLATGHVNVIWQGDNNVQTLQLLDKASSPPFILNITGPELLRVREIAAELGRRLGATPVFRGAESPTACLGATSKAQTLFGHPQVPAQDLIAWTAEWVGRGGPQLGKATRFEVRDGEF